MPYSRLVPIALAAFVLTAAGCTATRTQKSLGETVDDSVVTTKVKSALIADEVTEARHINVDTHRGIVQLNGFVSSDRERTEATKVAQDVAGVRRVENNLQLRGAQRTVGAVVEDGVISTKVKLALAESADTKAYQIKVKTHAGTVQLGGWVDSENARNAAGRLAREVEGVVAVDNKLDVKL